MAEDDEMLRFLDGEGEAPAMVDFPGATRRPEAEPMSVEEQEVRRMALLVQPFQPSVYIALLASCRRGCAGP